MTDQPTTSVDSPLNTPKIRGELKQVSQFWEKQKHDQELAYKREHRHLSDRLVQLAVEQELSRQESEKLKDLLQELEDIDTAPTGSSLSEVKHIIQRHACVEQCRQKIEKLVRKSALNRHAAPVELVNYRADIQRTSAHDLAVAKLKEKKRLLHQHAPAPGGHYSISHRALDSPSGNGGPHSPAMSPYRQLDHTGPSTSAVQHDSSQKMYHVSSSSNYGFDDNKLRKMAVSSSLWGRGASAIKPKEDTNGHSRHHPTPTNGHDLLDTNLTPSEERLFNQKKRASLASASMGHYHPLGLKPRSSDVKTLSRASITRHSDSRSMRRRTLAMESLLNQLYEHRAAQHSIHPKDLLNCKYLRLTPSNVAQLEEQCHDLGRDPGLHAHLTEQQIVDHFENLPPPDHTHH